MTPAMHRTDLSGPTPRPAHPRARSWAFAPLILAALAGCETETAPVLRALPEVRAGTGTAPPRASGPVGTTDAPSAPQVSFGRVAAASAPGGAAARGGAGGEPGGGQGGGDISLDFVDADIREVAAQVLGTVLGVNYTIDPSVRGTATLRTTTPVARSQVLPALQALLAQNGAALTVQGGVYRVLPAAAAGIGGTDATSGGGVIALRYASAEDLARVLQPYVGAGGKVLAAAGQNALLVAGDPATREALISLVRAFDVDVLAGQSYALFPASSGGAKDFADALSAALRGGQGGPGGGSLAGLVRVVPMERINAVLVVSSQPRYVEDARRVYALVERTRRQTIRSWNVYYLQNGRSDDVAYVLQQAFTPGRVTARPGARAVGSTAPGRGSRRIGGGYNAGDGTISGGLVSGGVGGGLGRTGGAGGTGLGAGALSGLGAGGAGAQQDPAQNPANPLLGGLDPGGGSGGVGGGAGGANAEAEGIRIIPNAQNNAVLIYATQQERATIEAMLRKIDILPLQVRIDATIAEVTLNDTLQYGTQFFFKAGINGALNFSPAGTAAGAFASAFPGFVLSGPNGGNAALNALQAVTQVRVLSSPQVLVLDNEAARLQVGNLVPFLTSSSQSTITSNAPIINSIDYRETGVIMEVTPRVNSGGLVTLDISQEVSDVDSSATAATGINSPTFLQRNVTSRVVVQDGQTIGLAGLIRDQTARGNSGIPFLKDIPLLGLLAGRQDNTRTRTELLVLITPHVVHDQRDARALTEDLRDQLINAAVVPDALGRLRPSGSADPSAPLRRNLRLGQ